MKRTKSKIVKDMISKSLGKGTKEQRKVFKETISKMKKAKKK